MERGGAGSGMEYCRADVLAQGPCWLSPAGGVGGSSCGEAVQEQECKGGQSDIDDLELVDAFTVFVAIVATILTDTSSKEYRINLEEYRNI